MTSTASLAFLAAYLLTNADLASSQTGVCYHAVTSMQTYQVYSSVSSGYSYSCGIFWIFRCSGTRYRAVTQIRTRVVYRTESVCCPGYVGDGAQCSPVCVDCDEPGMCVAPDTCECPIGWTGNQCSEDIDECESGICDDCTNTMGSFQCMCPDNTTLPSGQLTCIEAPQMLSVNVLNSTSLNVSWEAPNVTDGELLSYSVTCSQVNNETLPPVIVNPLTDSVIVHNLAPNTTSTCCIYAITTLGTSSMACQTTDGCTHGSARIVNGSNFQEGRVEVCLKGLWGTICDDSWSQNDANVVCWQLGYSNADSTAYISAYFGQGVIPVLMTNISCSGSEQELTDCSYSSSTDGCNHNMDAGVECLQRCIHGSVRILDGSHSQEGRVEVCLNGGWGTVCDDFWSQEDANVVCRQLGYSNSDATALYPAYFGQGIVPILLDDVGCSGSESHLISCSYDSNISDCSHSEDAGVRCQAACTHGSIQLRGSSLEYQGRVEVCVNGVWGSVCDNYWGIDDAKVACRKVGYPIPNPTVYTSAAFGQASLPILLDNVSCNGSESTLTSCIYDSHTVHCNHTEDAGVKCQHVPTTVSLGTALTSSVGYGSIIYYEYYVLSSGITISLTVANGTINCYASARFQNPNRELYEWLIVVSSYADFFIDPNLLGIAPGSNIFVALQGVESSNTFTLHSTEGDARAPLTLSSGLGVSDSLRAGERTYYEFEFATNGVTLRLNVTSGTLICYASGLIQNPNEEQGYVWRVTATDYIDIFLDPDSQPPTVGSSLYVGLEGVDISNNFSINSTTGDRRVPQIYAVEEEILGSLQSNELYYIQLEFSTNGITFILTVNVGYITCYASDTVQNPNEEQGHEWKVETNSSVEVYLDPNSLEREVGLYVYIGLEGGSSVNNFSLNSASGDRRTPTVVTTNSTSTDTIEEGELVYYQFNFPSSGVTITLNITSGSVICYASDRYQNPNEAQGYDWKIEVIDYGDIFLDPSLLTHSPSATVYVSILGIETSNYFTLGNIEGDRRVPATVSAEEIVTGSVAQGERMFFRLAFPSDELTIQLSAQTGHVVCYASDRLTNPTDTQGYDWRVETDDYTDIFIDPILLQRDPGVYIYIAVEGLEASNNFSLNSTLGDHRVPFDALIGSTVSSSLSFREVIYYRFSFPSTGLTFVLDISNGSVVCYASDSIQNPNRQHGYSFSVEASYYNDSYIDPSMAQGAVGGYIFVGVEGKRNTSNNTFSLNSTAGDTATKVPDPPYGLQLLSISATSANITWEAPLPYVDTPISDIEHYELMVYENKLNLPTIAANTNMPSYVFTGLEEFINYTCEVAAVNRVGQGQYSSAFIFSTLQGVPSSAPSNLTGDVQSATLVVFSWLPPPIIDQNGVIDYYVVKIHEVETNNSLTFNTENEDISIGSLHPFYCYDCTVAAHTVVGIGPYSTAVRVQTEEAAPRGSPQSLMSQKNSTSLTLSWDPPSTDLQNGIIRRYIIRIVENDTSTVTIHTSNITTLFVNDLHPYYTYKCSVATETVGIGPYTTVLIVQLDEDSPSAAPVNPNGSSPSSTSVHLSWDPPPLETRNGIIRSYIINSTELETNYTFCYTSLNTSLTINSLHPYYRYQFTVSAVTISSGPPSPAFTVQTQEDVPSSPVRNSSAGGTTSTSISLTWAPPPDDQKNGIIVVYIIRIISVDTGTTVYFNSSTTSITILSLSPYSTYECSVAAATRVGRGPFSSSITVQTDEAAPSVPPQNLTGTIVNSRAISLSWLPPLSSGTNGVIREYKINVTEVETETVFMLTSATTSITLHSLHPHYTYSCVVSAHTVGDGPYTAVFNITTPEDVPTGYPQNFSVSTTSSRSALLTWDPPETAEQNGIVTEYAINVSAVETGEEFQLTSMDTFITVTSLRPYTTYHFIISASTSVGLGPFSTVFAIHTSEDVPTSAPQDPSGYALSSSSIFLSWSPSPALETHGMIREYRINLTEQETGTLTTYTSSSTSIEVSLLHPFYTYHWTVTAVTIGEGPYTTSHSVTTLEDVPSGPPVNFSAEDVFSRSFTLTWELPAPSERNGNITGYTISVISINSNFDDPQLLFTTSQLITVDDLEPHTYYVCSIAANTSIGMGPFSLEIIIQTEQDVPGAPPSNTTGMAVNSTHVHLTWDPPPSDQINGVIQGYRIDLTELDTGEMSQYTAEDTEATIGPLHPHYNYNFSIVTFTLAGNGPTTFVIVRTAEAAPASAPGTFQATADVTSIFMSWTPPPLEDQNGIIRHYEVTLLSLEAGEIHIHTSVALSINISSLRPYTTYNCTVAAETVGTGPTTMGIIVQTLQAAPSAPPGEVQVSAENSRTLWLRWQPPNNSSRNGIIQGYHINISETHTGSSFLFETNDHELHIVVGDLHPFYQYLCSVAAETVDLGPFSTAVAIHLPEDAPSSSAVGLSTSSVTSTSFLLSWSPPPPADQNGIIRHYLINVAELDTGDVYSYSTMTTEFNVEFLHPYYFYNCSVSAVTITAGPHSSPVTIRTEIDVPSSPPQSTDTLVLLSMSLLLTWDLPLPEQQNGPIVGYTVRVVRVNSGITTDFDTNDTVFEVTSLDPYTLYEWTVAAKTISGTGPFSSPLVVQTLPDAPDDAPQNVSAVNVEARVIELSWSAPPPEAHNGEIANYIITYTEIQTGRISSAMSFNTDIALGNLHPFYNYTITVAAFTVAIGPPSNTFTVQTLEDAPSTSPTDISAIALSATELNITWQPPLPTQHNGIIRNYVLTVSVIDEGTSDHLSSSDPQLMLQNLHPFYTYSFLIAAVTIAPGPLSDIFSIQMPQAAPVSPPLNISIEVVSSESISMTWTQPLIEDQNGIITSYSVRIYSIVTGETMLYLSEGHHLQTIIDNLHPYYEYDVSIAAETVQLGPFSMPQSIQTLEDIPSAAPQNATVTAVNSRSILLNWLPPPVDSQNGVIRWYRVAVSVWESSESFIKFTEETHLVFDVAHPYYTYTFAIASETIGGPGPFGEELMIVTPEDVPTGPPQYLSAVTVSSSSIQITWVPPLEEQQNGMIRSYHINITEVPTGNVRELIAQGNESINTVTQLHPYYLYMCTVAAYTVGIGPAAFTQTLTHEAVPSKPKLLLSDVINDTAVHLLWATPDTPNGIILEYQVIYYGYMQMPKSTKMEIVDGVKVISIPAKAEKNPVYDVVINNIIAGLTYEFRLRARTSVGYGENVTVSTIIPSAVIEEEPQRSGLPDWATGVIVLAIVGTIIILCIMSMVGSYYFIRRYRMTQSIISATNPVEIHRNSDAAANASFELQSSANGNDNISMTEHEEESDIDEKPPLDKD